MPFVSKPWSGPATVEMMAPSACGGPGLLGSGRAYSADPAKAGITVIGEMEHARLSMSTFAERFIKFPIKERSFPRQRVFRESAPARSRRPVPRAGMPPRPGTDGTEAYKVCMLEGKPDTGQNKSA
jgi:hypothetical protein